MKAKQESSTARRATERIGFEQRQLRSNFVAARLDETENHAQQPGIWGMSLKISTLAKIFLGFMLLVSPETQAEEHPSQRPGQQQENRKEQDWPMYGRNLVHSFSNPASRINRENVATLKPETILIRVSLRVR